MDDTSSALLLRSEQLRQQMQDIQPGFVPESVLQIYVFMGEFEEGMAHYTLLSSPSAQDERWMGQCCSGSDFKEKALEHFLKAIMLGYEEARIELARLLMQLGRVQAAWDELNALDPGHLQGFNQALWYRANGSLLLTTGQPKEAVDRLFIAWKYIQTTPEFPFLAPAILFELSQDLSHLGDVNLSLYYIQRGIEICKTRLIWFLKHAYALSIFKLGRYEECLEIIEDILENSQLKFYEVQLLNFKPRIYKCLNHLDRAMETYQKCIDVAIKNLDAGNEFEARINLATLLALTGRNEQAHHHAHRAKRLIADESDGFYFSIRKAYVDYRNKKEKQFLDSLKVNYEDVTENMRHLLILCGLLYESSDPLWKKYFNKYRDLVYEYDGKYFAFEEWCLFPEFRAFVAQHYPQVLDTQVSVQLITIDREMILVDGQILHVPLKKTIELLAFLLFRESCTLEEILSHVFADQPPSRAKNYFHQIRHVLKEKTSRLEVVFHRPSQRYQLKSIQPVEWDLKPFLQRKHHLRGCFLPSSGSDWVLELNQQLTD